MKIEEIEIESVNILTPPEMAETLKRQHDECCQEVGTWSTHQVWGPGEYVTRENYDCPCGWSWNRWKE